MEDKLNLTPVDMAEIMFGMQDELNKKTIGEDWRNAGKDWLAAIIAETGELLDHLGYKWWKKQVPNIRQAKLEAVDLLHFAMSADMANRRYEKKAVSDLVAEIKRHTVAGCETERAKDMVIWIGSFDEYLYTHSSSVGALLSALQMSINEVFCLYVGKNALNELRQNYGYADGTYPKMWGNQEDNEVLYDIVLSMDVESMDHMAIWKHIYDRLEHELVEVLSNIGMLGAQL